MIDLHLRLPAIATTLMLLGAGGAIADEADRSSATDLAPVEVQSELLGGSTDQPGGASTLDRQQLEAASDDINIRLPDDSSGLEGSGPANTGELPSAEPAPNKVTIDIVQ